MAAMPKIERTTSLPATPKTQGVTRTQSTQSTPAATALPTSPGATFAGQAPTRELIPAGKPVATSASPNALWGDQPKPVSLDRAAFEKLSPAEKKEVFSRCAEERNRVGQDIEQRVEQLDTRWKNSRLSTRTEALREYEENGQRLPPHRRRDLDRAVDRSESAQRKINELTAKIDQLPKTPEAKAEMKELRTQLARELRKARDEQSKAVKEATAVVDAEGLKVDRLAATEQIIDPSAPAPGSGDSLADKVVRFFQLDQFFSWAVSKFDVWSFVNTTFSKQVEERSERSKEDDERLRTNDRAFQKLRDNLAYLAAAEARALQAKRP
jgi:hypothetical protein